MTPIKPKHGNPLWAQLLVTLLLTAVIIAYIGGEYIRASETPRRLAHVESMVQSQLAVVAVTTLEAVIAQDLPVIEMAIIGMASMEKDIHRLEIVDVNNEVLIDWHRPDYSQTSNHVQLITFSQPIHFEGVDFGVLRAGWDAQNTLADIEQQIDEVRLNIFVFMLVTAAVLLAWMNGLVIRPVSRINRRLLQGTSDEAIFPSSWAAREFQVLADSVTRLEEITISRDELEKEIELRKLAEVALLNARDEALEANSAKSDFLANMSHELRTPLNAIIGYSEMMEEEASLDGHEDNASDLKKIYESGYHLLALINDILDLSKIEAGKMELHLETFNLPDIINSVVAAVEPMSNKNGNHISLNGIDSVKNIKADATKVRQVLLNLLSNAVKFTEYGEIVLTVRSRSAGDIKGVEITVKDTGIGVSKSAQENLFKSFQQADVSTTKKYGGTGLGLSLCKHLCELMQGDIWVDSEPGRGSTFGIWLPQTLVDKANLTPSTLQAKKRAVDPKDVRLFDNIVQHTHKNERREVIATVLTIDDDANVRDLMARVYQREGFRPIAASSGAEGLDMARKLKPDLITLDIMMSGMDGWAVLKALKEEPDLRDIPVIMVSIVADKLMAVDVGAMDVIRKPIVWDNLLDLTRKAVRKPST